MSLKIVISMGNSKEWERDDGKECRIIFLKKH